MNSRESHKSVRVHAYLQRNLGDDLLVRTLARRYPDITFWISSGRSALKPFSKQWNIRRIPTVGFVDRVLRLAGVNVRVNDVIESMISRRSSAVVHIGGSIFIQRPNWSEQIAEYERTLISNKPCFVLDANFGPFYDQEYLQQFSDFFRKIEDVCFRDRYSAELFDGIPGIRVAPDVVFGCEFDSFRRVDGPVVVSLIDLSRRSDLAHLEDQYLEQMMRMVLELVKMTEEGVILHSFCQFEGDEQAVIRLMAALPEEVVRSGRVKPYFYNGDIDEAVRLLAEARAVIATRLHASILALALEKPLLPISYSAKIDRILLDIGFSSPWYQIEEFVAQDASALVQGLLARRPQDIASERAESENQFQELDNFMNE